MNPESLGPERDTRFVAPPRSSSFYFVCLYTDEQVLGSLLQLLQYTTEMVRLRNSRNTPLEQTDVSEGCIDTFVDDPMDLDHE